MFFYHPHLLRLLLFFYHPQNSKIPISSMFFSCVTKLFFHFPEFTVLTPYTFLIVQLRAEK